MAQATSGCGCGCYKNAILVLCFCDFLVVRPFLAIPVLAWVSIRILRGARNQEEIIVPSEKDGESMPVDPARDTRPVLQKDLLIVLTEYSVLIRDENRHERKLWRSATPSSPLFLESQRHPRSQSQLHIRRHVLAIRIHNYRWKLSFPLLRSTIRH